MNITSTYTILQDIDLVLEYYKKKTTINDIISLKKEVFSDSLYHSRIDILMDFRDTDLRMDKTDILTYLDFANNNIHSIGERKVAFLTRFPNDVVVGVIFEQLNNLPITTKVFSTLEHALNWLILDTSEYDRIEQIIDEFSKM